MNVRQITAAINIAAEVAQSAGRDRGFTSAELECHRALAFATGFAHLLKRLDPELAATVTKSFTDPEAS